MTRDLRFRTASLLAIKQIWNRNFLQFRKSWIVSIFWVVLEPLFILGAIGYGLGAFVSDVKGATYVEFFFPAILCNTSMMVAFFVATYENFSRLTHQNTYVTQILTPIEPKEIVLGEILWGATKGTFSAVGVALVASFFGLVGNWHILPALIVIFISSALFAAIGMTVTTYVRNYEQIIYPSSGFIIPMSLFCGTYFPIEQLPVGLQQLVYLFPLTHAVSVVRDILLRGPHWAQLIHLGILLALLYLVTRHAMKRLTSKLLN